MPEQIFRSVYHTTLNLLRILAQQGDPQAVIALKQMEETDFELIDDDESDFRIVVRSPEAEYLVTEDGTMQVPRSPDETEFFGG